MRVAGWVVVGPLLALSCTSLNMGSPEGSGGAGGTAAGSAGTSGTGAAGTGVAGMVGSGGGGAGGSAGGGTGGTAGAAGTGFEPDGLIAFWRFNEGTSTSIADSSGNGQTLTLSTGGAWTTMGHEGNGILLDGANDVAGVLPAVGQQLFEFPVVAFTMSAWVRPSTAAAGRSYASVVARTHEDFAFQDFWMGLVQGKPACSVHSPAQEAAIASGPALSTTAWTHIACTHDGLTGEITVWVNGAAVGTYYSGQNLGPIPTAILIGASETMQPSQMAQFFPGAIDDVRIYKRTLTPAEIAAIVR